jgi:predicted nicotinamide N-methyase
MDPTDLPAFVAAAVEDRRHPSLPEVRLALADDVWALWERADAAMGRGDLEPPFWAAAWPGGVALARHLLDHPGLVAGRPVLDVATGSGVVAIAAALAGAQPVVAVDLDPVAVAVARRNAHRNGVHIATMAGDVRTTAPPAGAVVTAGDVFYDRTIATAMLHALGRFADDGHEVLVGDPQRAWLPEHRLQVVAHLPVTVDPALEGTSVRTTLVARLLPDRTGPASG